MIPDSLRHAIDHSRPRFINRSKFATALAMVGAVLLFLGWYGVSGTATVGEQMPYLVSGSLPGAALIVCAAIVLVGESTQRSTNRSDALIAELHELLVEDAPDEITTIANSTTSEVGEPGDVVALTTGELYHRSDCALVAGKSGVEVASAGAIDRRRLASCPICEPERPEV